jgi:hypothetical protein
MTISYYIRLYTNDEADGNQVLGTLDTSGTFVPMQEDQSIQVRVDDASITRFEVPMLRIEYEYIGQQRTNPPSIVMQVGRAQLQLSSECWYYAHPWTELGVEVTVGDFAVIFSMQDGIPTATVNAISFLQGVKVEDDTRPGNTDPDPGRDKLFATLEDVHKFVIGEERLALSKIEAKFKEVLLDFRKELGGPTTLGERLSRRRHEPR